MEAFPGVFTSNIDAEDWEPLEEVPGSEYHALVSSADHNAGLWRIPGKGEITFRWSAPARDTFLVLEGEATIEIDDGPTLSMKPGSMASIAGGVEATWRVIRPYKDLYVIAGATGTA